MENISDNISRNIDQEQIYNGISRLRYAPDYGHGFLGLFRALFEGKLDEVIKDPGPPFIDPKHIPLIKKTLVNVAYNTSLKNKIPHKYAYLKNDTYFNRISLDSLID